MADPSNRPRISANIALSKSISGDQVNNGITDHDWERHSRFRLLHGTDKRRKRGMNTRKKYASDNEVLHELEEGDSHSRTLSSSESGSDQEFLEKIAQPSSDKSRIFKQSILHISIAVLFVIIALGAYRATASTRLHGGIRAAGMLSNGTSLFSSTTIVISLDGFRADYLKRGISPTLNALIENGVSPGYMLPSFPSVTFPNHYTLATGLFPESHGIVGNSFYDPDLKESFSYTDPLHSMQSKWWYGEPFWETAEKQGVPTAIHMWPGSEAHIGSIDPTYVDKFNGSEMLDVKSNRILEFIDKAGPLDEGYDANNPRPQLVAAYVPNVDTIGHLYGPNSTQIDTSISDVDKLLSNVLDGLEQRNLTNVVNIIVVSDHGMASTDESRVIQLEDLVDTSKIAHFDGWPHFGLRPLIDTDIQPLYESLLEKKRLQDGFDVYLRDRNMPERWHFVDNDRIAPLWIIPRTGWAIASRTEFDKSDENAVYHPKGIHGYDHEHPLMRAIFIARGPAFPHLPGSKLEPFQNTEVYNIICDSVGIQPRPSNGTLRLPFNPKELHETNNLTSLDNDSSAHSSIPTQSASLPTNVSPPNATIASQSSSNSAAQQWWEWITGKLNDIEDWVKDKTGNGQGLKDSRQIE